MTDANCLPQKAPKMFDVSGNLPFRVRATARLQSVSVMPWRARKVLLAKLGCDIETTAFLESGIIIMPGRLTVGARSYMNKASLLDCAGTISIGADVQIGPRVTIITTTHEITDTYPRAGAKKLLPVVIEDGCWIGAGALLLPGCVIRRGSVVAAGAVVRGVVEGDAIYAGIPARQIRKLVGPALRAA